jgi:hypothetical protein
MKYNDKNAPLVCMMTQSTCYKGTEEMVPLGALWHSTGANNKTVKRYVQPSDNDPNREELLEVIGVNKNGNDWNHKKRQAGVNAFIGTLADGTVAAVQVMPWNYEPWGCGKGSKGSCNNGWMQFEICEDDLKNKDYFDAIYKEGVELTAYYCKMYNLDPKGTVKFNGVQVPVILDHAQSHKLKLGSNHGDITKWLKKHGKTMEDVRNDVAKLIEESNVPVQSAPVQPNTLRRGSEGELVVELQAKLKVLGFDCGTIDGSYGPKTEAAVEALQKERKIPSDGICGPKTWAAIDAFAPYNIIVTTSKLNIRTGPGSIKYKVKATTKKGAKYTIVYKTGSWGKLKNGEGWVYLPYTKKA